jgi:hypothetical protein
VEKDSVIKGKDLEMVCILDAIGTKSAEFAFMTALLGLPDREDVVLNKYGIIGMHKVSRIEVDRLRYKALTKP